MPFHLYHSLVQELLVPAKIQRRMPECESHSIVGSTWWCSGTEVQHDIFTDQPCTRCGFLWSYFAVKHEQWVWHMNYAQALFRGSKGFESICVSLLNKHFKEGKMSFTNSCSSSKYVYTLLTFLPISLSNNNSKIWDFLSGRNYKGRSCGPHRIQMEPQMRT